MIRRTVLFLAPVFACLLLAAPAIGAEAENCEAEPRPACFGIESVQASLSTNQAGAHPDLSLDVVVKQDPSTPANVFGLHDSYAATRNIRFDLPPGFLGDPNALGTTQQCTTVQLMSFLSGGNCPNASQVGVSNIYAYGLSGEVREPVYMMTPPGGDVVARMGVIAGVFPLFIDFRVRSESDYGLVAEIVNSPNTERLIELKSNFWGVPAAPAHDTDRCTPGEVLGSGCTVSEARPPGGAEAPFLTNPTRCGVPLLVGVNASSWAEPQLDPEKEVTTAFPEITGCDSLPFGPSLGVNPTSHHTSAPTGLDMTIKLPASPGVKVLEPAQIRYIRIDLPTGLAVNTDSADGLGTCSAEQVHFEENRASECPDAAKLAATEFEIPVLERNLKGAIYLREPEPGHPYRIWIVADDLGLHVKLPGELELDKATGQIHSLVLGAPKLEGLPQTPLREVKLLFKSGFRAPLVTPSTCGTYFTHYEFVSWSGGPPATGETPMQIDEGCDGSGFSPRLSAGSTDSTGGAFSPFTVTISREDLEQNIAGFNLTLPRGLTASFAGIPHCEGAAAETGACPPGARIGKVLAGVGVGPSPLWIPQPGKRPTAVYLGGPYKGAPTSIVAVVPKQAGPFDFGDEVVRSAVTVDPVTARATAHTDPLPQFVEGTPLFYQIINVQLDRPGFALNPTSCAKKETVADLTSVGGKSASLVSSYAATDCAKLAFKPRLTLQLKGGTKRSDHPALTATLKMPPGEANVGVAQVALPHSLFLDQGSLNRVCTRVQFAAKACPAGSVYGTALARTPLFDFPLEGNVYLGTGYGHKLPDLVAELKGPPSFPIEIDLNGRIDEINEGIRNTFETVPDAPVSSFTLKMRGGKRGLLEISAEHLCAHTQRATVKFTGQNGRVANTQQALKTSCKKRKGK
ncbi:MAG: hypothetical protein ACTHK3_04570 [Solirubrobacterales bacterium]